MGVGLVKVVSAKLMPANEPALIPCKRVRKIKKESPRRIGGRIFTRFKSAS